MAKLRAPVASVVITPAVHANRGIEAWYRDKLYQLISDLHTSLALKLSVLWATNRPTIGYAQDASPTKELERLLAKWATAWTKRIDRLSLDLAKRFAAKNARSTDLSLEAAFSRAGFTVKFKPTRESLEAYRAVAAENVGLIKSIPQQYLKDVQTSVWQSVTAGADMSTLSKRLRKNYKVTTDRAALIARDQNNKAKAVIENTRRQQLGIERAVWQHSHGGKTPRPAHVAMNGKVYDLSKGMWDKDEREFVWPGQLINCRCTSRAIIPGFES